MVGKDVTRGRRVGFEPGERSAWRASNQGKWTRPYRKSKRVMVSLAKNLPATVMHTQAIGRDVSGWGQAGSSRISKHN